MVGLDAFNATIHHRDHILLTTTSCWLSDRGFCEWLSNKTVGRYGQPSPTTVRDEGPAKTTWASPAPAVHQHRQFRARSPDASPAPTSASPGTRTGSGHCRAGVSASISSTPVRITDKPSSTPRSSSLLRSATKHHPPRYTSRTPIPVRHQGEATGWTPLMHNTAKRCFISKYPGALTPKECNWWFELVLAHTPWVRPVNANGPMPRTTSWFTMQQQTCPYI